MAACAPLSVFLRRPSPPGRAASDGPVKEGRGKAPTAPPQRPFSRTRVCPPTLAQRRPRVGSRASITEPSGPSPPGLRSSLPNKRHPALPLDVLSANQRGGEEGTTDPLSFASKGGRERDAGLWKILFHPGRRGGVREKGPVTS